MLELDSPLWGDLNHAYGPADDLPALLRKLPDAELGAGYDTEPWFSLWSALCHQSDVYPASYAALPHIIAAAGTRIPEERTEYLVLASAIEAMRHKPGSPSVSLELEEAYHQALEMARDQTLKALAVEGDRDFFGGLLGALAAFSGYPRLSAAITNMQSDIDCPVCDATFPTPGYDLFQRGLGS